ncbi:MAG: DNA-binding transcriptional LysR family regulator [Candidatus Azotimanducaceae bacterium]
MARHRNFRQGAVELSVTQPALTRNIKSLEAILGGQLFDRLSTGVEPTGTGVVFLEKARQLLMDWSQIPDSLLTRNYDIAIADISSVYGDPKFDNEPLIDDPLYYVCRRDNPLANLSDVDLREAHSYPLIGNSVPSKMNSFLTNPGPSGSISRDTGIFFIK